MPSDALKLRHKLAVLDWLIAPQPADLTVALFAHLPELLF
jgi:hypothetical protein